MVKIIVRPFDFGTNAIYFYRLKEMKGNSCQWRPLWSFIRGMCLRFEKVFNKKLFDNLVFVNYCLINKNIKINKKYVSRRFINYFRKD